MGVLNEKRCKTNNIDDKNDEFRNISITESSIKQKPITTTKSNSSNNILLLDGKNQKKI
jgi:hypothetical protein